MGEDHRQLRNFIRESNRIERITREPTEKEIDAYIWLLRQDIITVETMCVFVANVAGANIRTSFGMNVVVGDHWPPSGGPEIATELEKILQDLIDTDPYETHVAYETLHPFTDGNGRSGRAIWLWQMVHQHDYDGNLRFMQLWYYQSLEKYRKLQDENAHLKVLIDGLHGKVRERDAEILRSTHREDMGK